MSHEYLLKIPQRVIAALYECIPVYDIRHQLGGALVELGTEEAHLVATDGHVLGVYTLPVHSASPTRFWLPADFLAPVAKLKTSSNGAWLTLYDPSPELPDEFATLAYKRGVYRAVDVVRRRTVGFGYRRGGAGKAVTTDQLRAVSREEAQAFPNWRRVIPPGGFTNIPAPYSAHVYSRIGAVAAKLARGQYDTVHLHQRGDAGPLRPSYVYFPDEPAFALFVMPNAKFDAGLTSDDSRYAGLTRPFA
jgi:hypothetical protein